MANSKFMTPVKPSEALAAIVGPSPLPRTEVTRKLWAYIKKDQVSMFDMTKLVSKHVS